MGQEKVIVERGGGISFACIEMLPGLLLSPARDRYEGVTLEGIARISFKSLTLIIIGLRNTK